MSLMKECLLQTNECSKLRNAVPKSCIHKSNYLNTCKCINNAACKLKNGYKYQQPQRTKPCPPISHDYKVNAPYATESIYNCSYMPYNCFKSRRQPIINQDQIPKVDGKIENETVHKMSFPIQCAEVRPKIPPKDHCIMGQGPMRTMTTQQHDFYLPCDGVRENMVLPRDNFCKSTCPMIGLTTTGLSYKPVCAGKVKNYKPDLRYIAPEDCMDLNTIHRASYQIVNIPKKEETPWAIQPEFCKPKNTVECCTVYNKSFMEPGTYVKNTSCDNSNNGFPDGMNCCEQFTSVKAADFEE